MDKVFFLLFISQITFGQIQVAIDAAAEVKPISPYLYGRNNSFSSTDPNWTLPESDLIRLRDAGVRFFRESGGNNSSKYNWRRKLSSHPDWYNNVYVNNWDQAAQALQKHFPAAQGMWAFPLLGQAAKSSTANFADWDYNRSQWWEGVNQNLAGGGVPNATGTKAKKEGDIHAYLEKWDADSVVGILGHWFGAGGIGLKREGIRYWNMDNEPEIWSGTHDDVMPKQITPQEFMQRYIATAKKAKAIDPEIRLAGPVTANEWQWYNWDGKPVTENGKTYPWLEYFIKTVAEEQQKSGVRLLDVLDIHFYPATKKTEEVVQLHRVFFDRDYIFPEANGVKTINGGYDNSLTREYIFARCNDWLNQYLGAGHGVNLGLTETGIDGSVAPSVAAVWYASTVGEFMKNNVEIFTPWTWKPGMWETLHLLSRYNQTHSVRAVSANEALISAYPSVNVTADSMTVVLINRSPDQIQHVSVRLDHFMPKQEKAAVYTLSQLPETETFISHTQNALKKSESAPVGNVLSLTLPAMSVTSVLLQAGGNIMGAEATSQPFQVFPNPTWDSITVKWADQDFDKIMITEMSGKQVLERTLAKPQREAVIRPKLTGGVYLIHLTGANGLSAVRKIIVH
ncbi:T9SS type A sorting domain-containing protein [Dyadobacter sp. CY261]|uniref:glycoside hydrolase family 44 protein n=1 Tax=Dyadobacter sp. CY261 TaxID=2907203 RepID=UPI001F359524|nr:glycoside hydrolase family 44 protein [Dyadobacter sp. CY261]MCF0072911.1 T9SS type A sorting domain-containing protein [Dyadobacter sp. CY261]